MRIRAARRDDFEAVTALLEELGRPQVTEETEGECRAVFDDQVVHPDAHHMVAEDEQGQVVAFCSLHFRSRLNFVGEEAWIPDLIVTEHARRHGLGRALLDEAERRALERGCVMLALESGYQRAEAHHMYRQARMQDRGKYFVKVLAPARAGAE